MIKQGLFCLVIAILALSVSCEELNMNEVVTGVFTKSADTVEFVLNALVDSRTQKTYQLSVSLFPMMGKLSPQEIQTPVLALTAGTQAGVRYGDASAIASAETPYQSIIIPPMDAINVTVLPIHITAEAVTFTSTVTYYISASLVNNILDPTNILSQKEGTFQLRQRVQAGQRLFFQFEPQVRTTLFIEECSYMDSSNRDQPLTAAFIFNTTTDEIPEYDQEFVDFPCGKDVGGNIVVSDPQNDKDSRYLKVCPSFVHFTTGQPMGTYFAVDVLRFWQEPNELGYLDWSITIYTSTFVDFPLEHSSGDPDFVQIATIEADTSSKPDLVLKFEPWKYENGSIINSAFYSVFTDIKEDQYSRENLIESNIFTSACYLVENSHSMLWQGTRYSVSELNHLDDGTFELVLKDFFNIIPEQSTKYHLSIVASTEHLGDFAYSYVTFSPDGDVVDSGLEGWAIFLIVLAVLVALVVIAGIVIAGVFVALKLRQRNSYDEM